eukprot:SAG22_NODE_1051_length_5815_cov_32.434570_1_plen_93_part_00
MLRAYIGSNQSNQAPDDGPEQFDAAKLGASAVDKHGQLLDEYAVPEFKGLWQNGTGYGGNESRGIIDKDEVLRLKKEAERIKTTALSTLEKR